jgi:hypothetical protein
MSDINISSRGSSPESRAAIWSSDEFSPQKEAVRERLHTILEQPPLTRSSVLREIMTFLGRGHYLYLGHVSLLWQRLYRKMEHADSTMTSFESACACLVTLKYAIEQGLDMASTEPNFPRAAGRYASLDVLLWAKDNGLPWIAAICTGAAEKQRFELMKRLHVEHDCPWDVGDIARAAAEGGHDTLSFLQWLWEQVSMVNSTIYVSIQ